MDRRMIGPFASAELASRGRSLSFGKIPKGLAYDKSSARFKDADGRLHLLSTHISKACVSDYLGSEIPSYKELGLQPDKIYKLLRDPVELEKAASTFNGLPVLYVHKPTNAAMHIQQTQDLVVGATGTNAVFNAPYLDNALVIWPQEAIDGIEDDSQRELSCGYYYRPDMTPGVYEGVKYDGVMRDMVGNHVALVEEGRAGPDVLVGDSAINVKEENDMTKGKGKTYPSRTAVRMHMALDAIVRPKLAKDKKPDWKKLLHGVSLKNFMAQDGKTIDKKKVVAFRKMAKDSLEPDMTPEAVAGGGLGPDDIIDRLLDEVLEVAAEEGIEVDEMVPPPAQGAADPVDKKEGAEAEDEEEMDDPAKKRKAAIDAMCAKGMSEDDASEIADMFSPAQAAGDAEPAIKPGGKGANDEEKDMVSKPAMDAALKANSEATEKRVMDRQRSIFAAIEDVRPWVGSVPVMAHDSAESVYRASLDSLGVKGLEEVKEVPALKAVLYAQPKPGEKPASNRMAADSAIDSGAAKSLSERYPHAAKIARV